MEHETFDSVILFLMVMGISVHFGVSTVWW